SAAASASGSASAGAGADGAGSAGGAAAGASGSAGASGGAAPSAGAIATGPRIWGKSRFTWIHPTAYSSGAWVGYLGLGGSVQLKGGDPATARVGVGSGRGCEAWYAVEPAGFVCAGDTASVDPKEEITAALIQNSGKAGSPWPFEYGESLGAPRYTKIPTPAEMRKAEWDLDKHLEKVSRARGAKSKEEVEAIDKAFVGADFSYSGLPAPELPEVSPFVREARRYVAPGSTVAWVRELDVEFPGGEIEGLTKRTFLLTSDFALVPKDRVRPYPKSQFKGVVLGDEVKLPLAFFRKTERPKYRRGKGGAMEPTGESWAARAWTMVTGEEVTEGKERYLATREEGVFAKAEDATVIDVATPPSKKITEAAGRGTWLDISILGGWLVAYEKTRPVFATLISPGRGGVPFPGLDPVSTASTPTGNFRVDGKFLWATMVSSSNSDIVHTEVQYVQNFHGPHALHGAYWHEVFGEPKSGGCVNLSPIDSKWVFEFTEPALPAGWHGMRSTDQAGYATIVSVHR
ncbi:MAG: L,D-transpeptidase, partial [Polyangiaceae bacterium]